MPTPRRSTLLVLAASVLGALALAGAALALTSHKTAAKPVYQVKCANGAIKAVAVVIADQNKGFQTAYTNDPSFFRTHWSCNPKAVFQARRVDRGVYDIRVLGNLNETPIVTPLGGAAKIGVSPLDDGGWEVRLIGPPPAGGGDTQVDEAFVLVLL